MTWKHGLCATLIVLSCGCSEEPAQPDLADARTNDAAFSADACVDRQTSDGAVDVFTDTSGDVCMLAPIDDRDSGITDGSALAVGLQSRPENTTCRALPRPTGGANDPFPKSLRATGCFLSSDLREPVSGLIAYDVNAPLWSDGADKRRFMMVPTDGKIHVNSDGHLVFPIGSMLIKTFSLRGTMLETRFLVRHDDGEWAGYTYVWNDSGEAALLEEETRTRNVGGQTWIFPNRAACLTCHTAAAGRTLGLEVAQLNRTFTYDGSKAANQLDTLSHVGLFDTALPPSDQLARFPLLSDPHAGGLTARARAYLHANCSHCHRPSGLMIDGNVPNIDLRFDVPLSQTNMLGQAPLRGDFGIPGVKLINPGLPLQSMLRIRMKTLVSNVRMPAIGSTEVDETGLALISSWITSMSACTAN